MTKNPKVVTPYHGEQSQVIVHDITQKFTIPFEGEIKGLGEVYEIMSVERLRKSLKKDYGRGCLYLAPNSYWWNYLDRRDGGVDCPPWKSKPGSGKGKPNFLKTFLAKIIFWFLVRYEEWTEIFFVHHIAYKFEQIEGEDN